MSQMVWTRLDGTARSLAPFALTVLLIVVGMVPPGGTTKIRPDSASESWSTIASPH